MWINHSDKIWIVVELLPVREGGLFLLLLIQLQQQRIHDNASSCNGWYTASTHTTVNKTNHDLKVFLEEVLGSDLHSRLCSFISSLLGNNQDSDLLATLSSSAKYS